MITKAIDILQKAKSSGVHIYLEKNQLQLKFSKGKSLDPQLLDEIKSNKQLIIHFLNDNTALNTEKSGAEIDFTEIIRHPKQRIPLSFGQERLWFIDRLEGSTQYHMPAVLKLKGSVNREALEFALQSIVGRHEVLRTVFLQEAGNAYQHIKADHAETINFVDGTVYENDPIGLNRLIQQLINKAFDLSKDNMLRAHLVSLNEADHILVATMHHIASDGWSRSILVKEVVEFYNAYEEKRPDTLAALPLQYADYAIWQHKYLSGDVMEKKLSYWKGKLENAATLQLPTDFIRPAIQSTRGASVKFAIDKDLSDRVVELGHQQGATVFMTLLAAFKVLLYHYSGQQDICVGSAIAGRQQQELEKLIGLFANTLVLRTELNESDTFIDLLKRVRRTTMEAYENQEVPFEKVVDAVVKERSLSRSPLAQVMFALQNTPEVPQLQLGQMQLSNEGYAHTTAMFDITFFVNETSAGLQGMVEYSTDLYREATLVKMIGNFKVLLAGIVEVPNQSIALLPLLTTIEQQQLVADFNNTALMVPANKTIIDLFEAIAKNTPAAAALIGEEGKLTYQELNERSNQLAHYLITKGVKREVLVPVCLKRSMDLIVSLLAILKAGGVYVPIDPGYPEERIRYMLEDTAAHIVISNNKDINLFEGGEVIEVIALNDSIASIKQQPVTNLGAVVIPGQLANVIYTSGSTGKPKGVMIEHSGLMNLVEWHNTAFKVTAASNSTTMAGVGFDAFGWEIWPYLSIGASLLIIDDDARLSTARLMDLFNEHQVTHSFIATALVTAFVQESENNIPSLEFLLTGGDRLPSVDIGAIGYVLVNNYGPTENSVVSTSYSLQVNDAGTAPPIGTPIANTQLYILNGRDRLVPVGVAGELCISGTGLARGYLNLPALTEEKFVKNPFSLAENVRMYRTGDICRWLPDGNIEYLGRKDEQVKIRGYRIELGEIENVLQQSDLVSQAIMLSKEITEGDKRLFGYFVPNWESVKVKELELYRTQIAGWKELYENEYGQTEGESGIDVEFNIIGWNDSFTKGAIPAEEMADWVRDIVEVIMSKQPVNVLEIGSGTGLIYYQLAGKLKKYIGTDFSKSSISQIAHQISKGARDYGDTELKVCAAHEIVLNETEQIDTIILNSIVQYFPGEDYMSTVIENGISILKGNGRIIIGDVRDNRLLKYFKGRLHLLKAQQSVGIKEFNWILEQETLNEEELCFSPEYFYQLANRYPQITHIDIQWKQSEFINELTLYRYTVIVYVGMQNDIIDPDWKNWEITAERKALVSLINEGAPIIALKDAPNPRLWKERQLGRALQDNAIINAGDIIMALEKEDAESIEINGLLKLAMDKGYRCRLLLDEDPMKVNILLELTPGDHFVRPVYGSNVAAASNTNIPLFAEIMLMMQKDIRSHMERQLPDYMLPSELYAVGKLPLTNNGKVDKRFLSQIAGQAVVIQLNYKAPRTAMETTMAGIWQVLIGIDKVGIEDNFFDLGGHSLMVMRLISAVRKELGLELAIKDLFLYPTIAELADFLQTQGAGLSLPPVEALARPGHIPLSFSQERLWFVDRLEGSVAFHTPVVLALEGNLHKDALVAALQAIVNRHEVLRTVFKEADNGIAYQHVNDKDQWVLNNIDGQSFQHNEAALQQTIHQLIKSPFNLAKDHMLRADLISMGEQKHLLIITLHHIASDAWSLSILVKEVTELYKAYVAASTAPLPPLPVQYADFALWQKANLQGEMLDYKLNYWKGKLQGVEPLKLPTDFPRPILQSTKGTTVGFKIDQQLADQIHELGQQQGSTLFMTLLATFNVLMHRYSGQQDICVGTSIAGRQQQEIENLIGFFVNILALRIQVEPDMPFINLLQQVKQTTLEAYEHQEVPFEKVVDAVVKERDMSRSPLFQVLLVVLNTPEAAEVQIGDLILSGVKYERTVSKYDITLFVTESPAGLSCSVEYSTELFTEQTISRMMGHFKELLQSIVDAPAGNIAGLAMLTKDETSQLLHGFNNNLSEYPAEKSIAQLFEEQVDEKPASIALVFEEEVLSYQQLNERSNQLAHYLLGKGVTAGGLVAVCMERSVEMMIAILGILKAGGAYVPIDSAYPEERIRFMLADTGCAFMITSKSKLSVLPVDDSIEYIVFDRDWSFNSKLPLANIIPVADHNSLAYVMYTSGSTGKPKGVMVTQQNVVSLVKGVDFISLSGKSILLSTGSSSFDATTIEYWGMLLNGGCLVLCTENKLLDNNLLKATIVNRDVNTMWFTSGWFNQLVEADIAIFKTLETVMVGGEKLSPPHIGRCRQAYPRLTIINGYGPTENTTFSLTYHVTEMEMNKSVPIGRPLNNRSAFILDSDQQLVPIGVYGEICLGGAGLAKGYLNRPELTAEKFIQHPLTQTRLYKTGDIGRWLMDGNIDYLGRKDEQVKIRGYRIELGEIENVLLECTEIEQVAVLGKTDTTGTTRLIGYIVPKHGFDKQAIFQYLKTRLPDYMIPAMLVEMDELPLTNNGKINKGALPDPDITEVAGKQYVAPETESEKVLATIWERLLDLEQVGVHDNFFEIGGDSLLAIRVVAAIRKELEIEMPISNLFEYQTIAELAAQLEIQPATSTLPAIRPGARPMHIPLSFSQERLWFIDRLEGSLQYHIPAVMRLKGELNLAALQHALSTIINRHEVLRTIFLEEDGIAHQLVKEQSDWELPVTDGSSYNSNEAGLQQLIQQLINVPFDLSKDNMLRANLVVLNHQENILVVTLHHIASDGWSRSILVKEVAELYSAFEENREPLLATIPVQYADFAIWQRNYLQGAVLDKKLGYWQQKLQGVEPLQMPVDFPRPAIQTTRGASKGFAFDKSIADALQQLSQQQGSTLFMTLQTALNVLLYRYSGQKDFCTGTGIAGRQQQETEGLIGFFVNTLALRTIIHTEDSFTDLLQQVRKTTLEAYENQDMPFEKVVDTVINKRDRSRNPLFQVMFVLQNTPEVPSLTLGKLQLAREGYQHTTAQFDLSFSITEYANGLDVSLEYNIDLYAPETIDRLVMHFKQLVNSIVNQPQQKISELSIMSKEEVRQVIVDFNANDTSYPNNKTIIALFNEQVAANPQATAVVFGDEQYTFGQLNERANQLGHYLQQKGVSNETLIAISMERSLNMMVGILGILKAGAAYVPIDAAYPADRIRFMLEDTAVPIVITSNQGVNALPVLDGMEVVNLDLDWQTIATHLSVDTSSLTRPESLAYIIYTSGSTGKPKGVMVTQQNVVSLVKGIDYVSLTNTDTLLSTGSSSFDATTIEYWGMLLNGGKLVLCDESTLADSRLLKIAIDANKVNRMWFTSSWFNQLVETDMAVFESLDTIMVGGEKLSEFHIQQLRQTYPHIEIINGYGPTENTTFSLTYAITESEIKSTIPIGRPLNNRKAYVLDERMQPVPVGVPGEICLGGAGLSRGYLNRPELTAEKFVANPFNKNSSDRIYKTGDIGRWLPGGNIEYLGRVDEQVKIRGYRIELGEIETVLQETGLVKQAVVTAHQQVDGNKILVGYIVPSDLYNKSGLVANLQNRLPEYMIPALWVELERLPLTTNGKVDKRALPDPGEVSQQAEQYVAPVTDMEKQLVMIWQDILKKDQVGINDNFFELGGHSLLAMRLISAVRKELKAELAVKDLFANPTIVTLANHLQQQDDSTIPAIEAYPRTGPIPLSFSQERLWFIDQLEGSVPYNSPTVLRLKGKLNQDALTNALKQIVNRHEVLRTVFYESAGTPYQSVKDGDHWNLSLLDGSEYKQDRTAMLQRIEQLISAPFDLAKDYMLRAALIMLEEMDYVLVVTMHHIASDGWSLPIIVKEVVELYSAFVENRPAVLPALPLQYADYATWQRKYLQGEVLNKKTGYWKKKLEGVQPLQLTTDFNRPATRTVRGASVNLMLDKELADRLNQLSQQHGTTLYMTLLATYQVMLQRYSGQQDICVGASIANRPQQELEGLIGFFVNTLALRSTVDEEISFAELLQQVKTTMLEAYENQEVPFEKVVEEVVKERDPARTPLFQVMLVLLNIQESSRLGFGEVELSNEAFDINISKFEITFHVSQSAHGLPVSIVYNTDLFREDTIRRMAGHFKQLLQSVIQDPQQSIDALQMLTEEEEQQLLAAFN